MFDHVGKVQATHVDGPAGWGVVEGVRCLCERCPVAQQWGVFPLLSDEVVPHDGDADASWADVLLGTSVHDAILGPVDLLGAEVRRHVAHERLSFWHFVEWELPVKLEALDGLVVAVVEVLGIWPDVPVVGVCNS